jgi:hypothetical protein
LDETVSADENITRFINQKAYFRSNGTVRHNAFMPNRDGEVSVYRISEIDDSEVYAIGTKYFAEITGKPLMGRADIIVSEVFKHDLRIQPHQDPHPRHASICGYPDEKPEQKLVAIELAAEAQLHLI